MLKSESCVLQGNLFKSHNSFSRCLSFLLIALGINANEILQAQRENQDQKPGGFSYYIDAGYSANFSKTTLLKTNTTKYYRLYPSTLPGFVAAFGLDYDFRNFFIGTRFRNLRTGNNFEIESDMDSSGNRLLIFARPYKTNWVASFYSGLHFEFGRFSLKPSVGLDYFLFPGYYHNSLGIIESNSEKVYIDVKANYNLKPPLQATIGTVIGYSFKFLKRKCYLAYAVSYAYGLTNIYTTTIEFYGKESNRQFQNINRGTNLTQCLRLYIGQRVSLKTKVTRP